ncbi:MAG: PP2C family protein-serine/threonine phosphatase [Firmicutes bacterium]|nr:PP2C family protein-serine/threonine phosphatase [Bacillota bacterium]
MHEDDEARYKKYTTLEYIRDFFYQGNRRFTLTYRRIIGKSYEWVTMRIFASSEYTQENQKVILIVQKEDAIESLELMSLAKVQFEIMRSIASTYVTMHAIKLDDDTVVDLSNATNSNLEFNIIPNATKLMIWTISKRIHPDYLELGLQFTDLTTLKERLTGKKQLSMDLLGNNVGWIRAQFIPTQFNEDGTPSLVLFTTADIDEGKRKEEKLTQISTELNLATHIQTAVLPNSFPAYPNKNEFDIYASMHPAKEVGGDFYDFYFLDDDHFAMVIADVSGKGIPAALFMMVSKAIIKNQAANTYSPAEILAKVNTQLCENNDMDMFVTVWLGILEVSTGKLVASNAGHEYPALKRSNGKFELFTDKHSLALGCFPSIKYRNYDIQLHPGDCLYVYTDGVTEATNKDQELFGTNRMIEALNEKTDEKISQKLATVMNNIQGFVQDAPQFDDITMMILKYNGMK